MTAILWFRQDLRLSDNPALSYVSQHYKTFIPLYIWDETTPFQSGSAQKWWLHHSLEALDQSLKETYKIPLFLFRGNPLTLLKKIIQETHAEGLFWNRCYDPHSLERDTKIKSFFKKDLTVESFNGSVLFEPWEILNKSKKPFRVFTPFYKTCIQHLEPHAPLKRSSSLEGHKTSLKGDALSNWKLLPTSPNWAVNFSSCWTPGEQGAKKKLQHFLSHGLSDYEKERDYPANPATSCLSPTFILVKSAPIIYGIK